MITPNNDNNLVKLFILWHFILITLFYVFIIDFNMNKTGSFILQRLFLYPIYILCSLAESFVIYYFLPLNIKYIKLIILLCIFNLLCITYTFPSSENFSLTDLPSKVEYVSNIIRNSKKPSDIFTYTDSWAIKALQKKYNLPNIYYIVEVRNYNGKFINEYSIFFSNSLLYSNNFNLKYIKKNSKYTISDTLPIMENGKSVLIFYDIEIKKELIEVNIPKNINFKVNIKEEQFILYDFGFLSIAADLAD